MKRHQPVAIRIRSTRCRDLYFLRKEGIPVSKMVLYNVRVPLLDGDGGGGLYTLEAENGKWSAVIPQSGFVHPPGAVPLDAWDGRMPEPPVRFDAGGKILLPGLVDAHMHLDKSFSLPYVGNASGTLEEAVHNYAEACPSFSKDTIRQRMLRAALLAVSYGTSAIRTHLDFHVEKGRDVAMRTVEAALEVKEALKPYVTIQLFPLIPQNHITPGTMELAEETIRMGVDGIGAAPHLSDDPNTGIDRIFRLAEQTGCPVDFHTDESDDPAVRTVVHIARRTMELGFSGRVTVGHLCSLAAMSDEEAEPIIRLMAEAGLKAVSLPGANLYLQGRHDRYPVRRGVTRIRDIAAAGVPIAVASDNIHDPFHPFGRGDLLLIALIAAYAAHLGSPSDMRKLLRMITVVPAGILGLADYGVRAGCRADFVIFDADSPEMLLTLLPERRWVHRGDRWLRIAAPPAGWSEAALQRYWDEAGSLPVWIDREEKAG